jgi:hypothetical protein
VVDLEEPMGWVSIPLTEESSGCVLLRHHSSWGCVDVENFEKRMRHRLGFVFAQNAEGSIYEPTSFSWLLFPTIRTGETRTSAK